MMKIFLFITQKERNKKENSCEKKWKITHTKKMCGKTHFNFEGFSFFFLLFPGFQQRQRNSMDLTGHLTNQLIQVFLIFQVIVDFHLLRGMKTPWLEPWISSLNLAQRTENHPNIISNPPQQTKKFNFPFTEHLLTFPGSHCQFSLFVEFSPNFLRYFSTKGNFREGVCLS